MLGDVEVDVNLAGIAVTSSRPRDAHILAFAKNDCGVIDHKRGDAERAKCKCFHFLRAAGLQHHRIPFADAGMRQAAAVSVVEDRR